MTSFLSAIDLAVRTLFYDKFKDILEMTARDQDVVFTHKDIAERVVSEKRHTVKLEFINIYREPPRKSDTIRSTTAAIEGINMNNASSAGIEREVVRSVPTDLNYSAFFWSTSLDKMQQIAERYLFWQYQLPIFQINYNDYPLNMFLKLSNLRDLSQPSDKYDKGMKWIYQADFVMSGAVFQTDDVKLIRKIVLSIYDSSGMTDVLLDTETIQ